MSSSTVIIDAEIQILEKQIADSQKQLVELLKKRSGETVDDYQLSRTDGSLVKLSELFGDSSDLIVIHNMGQGCSYCTLWADGFNGVWEHLENRASFVLVSGDDPAMVKEFSESRNWGFTCLSGADSEFTKDMGYVDDSGSRFPGISTFKKNAAGKITRVAHTWFGPGDYYCPTWHILSLLESGSDGWSPKLAY